MRKAKAKTGKRRAATTTARNGKSTTARLAVVGSRACTGARVAADIDGAIAARSPAVIITAKVIGVCAEVVGAARRARLPLVVVAANGDGAPALRSCFALVLANADAVIAVWDGASPTTKFIIASARRRRIDCAVVEAAASVELITRASAARRLAVEPQAITAAVKAGRVSPPVNKLYDWRQLQAEFVGNRHREARHRGRQPKPPPSDDGASAPVSAPRKPKMTRAAAAALDEAGVSEGEAEQAMSQPLFYKDVLERLREIKITENDAKELTRLAVLLRAHRENIDGLTQLMDFRRRVGETANIGACEAACYDFVRQVIVVVMKLPDGEAATLVKCGMADIETARSALKKVAERLSEQLDGIKFPSRESITAAMK